MNDDIREFRRSLRYLERFVMANLKDDSVCCGVTPNQCHILLETAEKGETDLSDLKNYLGLDKSSISRTIDSLTSDELLVRKENPEDRRYQIVALSEKGKQLVEDIDERCDLHYKSIFNFLPDKIKGRIIEDLQALSTAFEQSLNINSRTSCCGGNNCSAPEINEKEN